jgi:hypothetical protein
MKSSATSGHCLKWLYGTARINKFFGIAVLGNYVARRINQASDAKVLRLNQIFAHQICNWYQVARFKINHVMSLTKNVTKNPPAEAGGFF